MDGQKRLELSKKRIQKGMSVLEDVRILLADKVVVSKVTIKSLECASYQVG